MDIIEIEKRLSEDFPNNKIKAVEGFTSSDEFRKICIEIDGKEYGLTSRKKESILEEVQSLHGVDEDDIDEGIYEAVKFEVEVFLGI